MKLKELWHRLYIDPRRRRKMAKYGIPMLQHIDAAMKAAGKPYTLIYGSLLGAVREKGFIPHDCDVDVAIWADEDYSAVWQALEAAGFSRRRGITVDGGAFGKEETWKWNSIHVDFFYFFPDGKGGWYGTEFYPQDGCKGWKDSIEKFGGLKVLKTLLPITKSTHYVPFENIEMPVMDCAMDFVVDYYGPGWRVPDPTFVYPRKGETNYEECPDKLGVIKKA